MICLAEPPDPCYQPRDDKGHRILYNKRKEYDYQIILRSLPVAWVIGKDVDVIFQPNEFGRANRIPFRQAVAEIHNNWNNYKADKNDQSGCQKGGGKQIFPFINLYQSFLNRADARPAIAFPIFGLVR